MLVDCRIEGGPKSVGEVSKVLTNLNSSIQKVQRVLVCNINGRSGQVVVNVISKEFADVFQQVHSEDVVEVATKCWK